MLRSSGEHVVIDGNCLSACTLLLGIIPRERICATAARGSASTPPGCPTWTAVRSPARMGTQALWNIYPSSVRRWINRHGGLSRHMIFLQGRELYGFVPSCDAHRRARRRRAHAHRYRAHPGRYDSASAASDRR